MFKRRQNQGKLSFLKWIEESTSFFLRLGAARQSNNTVQSVISHDGKTVEADKEILDHVGQF